MILLLWCAEADDDDGDEGIALYIDVEMFLLRNLFVTESFCRF